MKNRIRQRGKKGENTVNSTDAKPRINMPTERRRFQRDRERIIAAYAAAVKAGGIGYDESASVLRRTIYSQGLRYLDAGRLPVLKRYVNKDLPGATRQWANSDNLFYWVVRLISSDGKVPPFVVASTWSKMESDLALAAAFDIHPDYLDQFLASVGGKAGQRNLKPEGDEPPPRWIAGITRASQAR